MRKWPGFKKIRVTGGARAGQIGWHDEITRHLFFRPVGDGEPGRETIFLDVCGAIGVEYKTITKKDEHAAKKTVPGGSDRTPGAFR